MKCSEVPLFLRCKNMDGLIFFLFSCLFSPIGLPLCFLQWYISEKNILLRFTDVGEATWKLKM